MKINKTVLKNALKTFNGIVRPNTVVPILENVKFVIANDGRQQLVVSDLETTMFVSVEAESPMDICINYAQLLKVCDSFQCETLEFELAENSVSIKCDKAKITLPTESTELYPQCNVIECNNILENFDFSPMGEAVWFAGNDEIRPAMTGVCLEIIGGEINIVATNASVLYLNTVAKTEHSDLQTVIPKNAAKKIAMLNDATLCASATNIQFTQGDVVIIARAIDTKFPQYQAVIPNEQNGKVVYDTKLFKETIDAASKFAHSSTKSLILDVTVGQTTISAQDIDYAIDYSNTIEAEANEPIRIAFNSEFLKLAIDSVTATTVELHYTINNRAAVIKEGTKTLLIMPIMIN